MFRRGVRSIYVCNLRGNARCSGEECRKEKENVFGEETRTTIIITMLVKNPSSPGRGVICYRDIDDYLTCEEMLHILTECVQEDPSTRSSIVRVSMETLDIVESLPPLDELPQTENWPIEWGQ